MRRHHAVAALLLLAACRRPVADQPIPSADADAQARTAAKTLDDIAAAERAAARPAPERRDGR